MDLIFYVLVEFVYEFANNKRLSKWIRYPLVFLITVFYLSVIGGLTYLFVNLFSKGKTLGSLVILFVDIMIIYGLIFTLYKNFIKKK